MAGLGNVGNINVNVDINTTQAEERIKGLFGLSEGGFVEMANQAKKAAEIIESSMDAAFTKLQKSMQAATAPTGQSSTNPGIRAASLELEKQVQSSEQVDANLAQAKVAAEQFFGALAKTGTEMKELDNTSKKLPLNFTNLANSFKQGFGSGSGGLNNLLSGAKSVLSDFGGDIAGATGALGGLGGAAGIAAGAIGGTLAGAIVNAIPQLVQMAKEALNAVKAMVDLAAQMEVLEIRIKGSFGEGAKTVNNFASQVGIGLGLTQQETLTMAANIADAFQQLGTVSQKHLGDVSIAVAQAASSIALLRGAATSDVLAAFNQALEGNIRALRTYGIQVDNITLRQTLLDAGAKNVTKTLDTQSRQIATTIAFLERAKETSGQFGEAQDTLQQQNRVLGASIKDIGTQIGSLLLPVVKAVATIITDLVFITDREIEGFKKFGEAAERAVPGLKEFMQAATAGPLGILAKGLDEVAKAMGKGKSDAEAYDKAIKEQLDDLAALHNDVGKLLPSDFDQIAEAQTRADRALSDGAHNIADAYKQLDRATEDASIKQKNFNVDSARKIVDANQKIKESEEDLLHTQQQAADKIRDAKQKVVDTQTEVSRQLRDDNEKIDDFELAHTRRVEDLQARIAEAHRQAAQAIEDAQFTIDEALVKGDEKQFNAAERQLGRAKDALTASGAVGQAERELAREQRDFTVGLQRLERKRDEDRLDGIEKIKKAKEDELRTERDATFDVLKAQEAVNKANEDLKRLKEDLITQQKAIDLENKRAMEDANEAINQAYIQMQQAEADAEAAFKRLSDDLNIDEALIKTMGKALSEGMDPDTVQALADEIAHLGQNIDQYIGVSAFSAGLGAAPGADVNTSVSGGLINGTLQAVQAGIQEAINNIMGGGRASGGDVFPGKAFVVGENGPELLVPSQNATVVPLNGSLGTVTNHITVNQVADDPEATAFAVASRLVRGVG